MKWISTLLLVLFVATSCQKDNATSPKSIQPEEGFRLIVNDTLVFHAEHIDFYDYSSHIIYLKEGQVFSCPSQGSYKVSIADDEIYSGAIHPLYASHLPTGPVIYAAPYLYGDYAVALDFHPHPNPNSGALDPRGDERIVAMLKKQNLYRPGLTAEIMDITPDGCCSMHITLKLTNKEDKPLLYIDPVKTGTELFHYFTNGLWLQNTQREMFTPEINSQSPGHHDMWSRDWLSVLESNESVTITLPYQGFINVPAGQYQAYFSFPGLSRHIARHELIQPDGRIWLGNLDLVQTIELQ